MPEETRIEAYRRIGEDAVRSAAAWPRYMRLNAGSSHINYTQSDDPIDREANRRKTERYLHQRDKEVKAMGLTDPNYKNGSTISVKGKIITDHGSKHGVLVEFNDGHRAWIPYNDISTKDDCFVEN